MKRLWMIGIYSCIYTFPLLAQTPIAGPNVNMLKQRNRELEPAIQMCDALSWNAPKLRAGAELLIADCLAHGRRQIVEVAQTFLPSAAYDRQMFLASDENRRKFPPMPCNAQVCRHQMVNILV